MPEACSECGKACEKAGGAYREYCPSCLSEKAQRPAHVQTCNRNECTVCDSWLRETKEWVSYLYTATQIYKSRQSTEFKRLDQFKK